MRTNDTKKIIIELERIPNGFKIKPEPKTVFIIKKNPQNPELNIQQKPFEIEPTTKEKLEQKSLKMPIPPINNQIVTKPKLVPTNQAPETNTPLRVEEPKTLEGKFRNVLSQLNPVIIPTSSIWFEYNSIHKIEQESLPEFFTNSSTKTPGNYKIIRNKILEMFHNSPGKYLTGLSCVEKLVI